jgi:predicted transcriptional regulator
MGLNAKNARKKAEKLKAQRNRKSIASERYSVYSHIDDAVSHGLTSCEVPSRLFKSIKEELTAKGFQTEEEQHRYYISTTIKW